MQPGISTSSSALEKELGRSAFVRVSSGLTKRCRVLKETSDGSKFEVIVENENHPVMVSARHMWFDCTDDINGSKCVVCFMSGYLLSCKNCGRRFHEDCSSMPQPKSPNSNAPKFTCRDCFFMLYASLKGMERTGSARNSLILIKEVKKYTTYAYRELRWDELFRYNNSSLYCYCGGPGEFCQQMVQCLRCYQWFHRACLHCLPTDREILPWDCFWYFKCAHCNGECGEVIKQIPVLWPEILHIALMNLNGNSKRFSDVKNDILPWLEKNWKLLKPVKNASYVLETEEKIIRRLRADPARFQCRLEIGGSPKEWRARCYQSGPLRLDLDSFFPIDQPISQEKLNDITFDRVSTDQLPLLTLRSSAKLPSINNFEGIYGNKDSYKRMEKRLQSSLKSDYKESKKTLVSKYWPDEDSSWLSFPDESSFLRKANHERNLDIRRTDSSPKSKKRKLCELRESPRLENVNKRSRICEKSYPSMSSQHSSSTSLSKCDYQESLESHSETSEMHKVETIQKTDGKSISSPIEYLPREISMKKLKASTSPSKLSSVSNVKITKETQVDVTYSAEESEAKCFGIAIDNSCDFHIDEVTNYVDASSIKPKSKVNVTESSSSKSSSVGDLDSEPPILRPRSEKTPRKLQVARKSGRSAPLCVSSPKKQPSPIVTRKCHVSLKNLRNWFEITGDQPPQICASGLHVLRTIPPYPCSSEKNMTPPFCYRWENSSRQRYSRVKVVKKGWPARHATSSPLTPRSARKKSAYDTAGVATILARRRPRFQRNDGVGVISSKLGDSIDKLKYSNPERGNCDEDEYEDILLQWNVKLVRVGRMLPI